MRVWATTYEKYVGTVECLLFDGKIYIKLRLAVYAVEAPSGESSVSKPMPFSEGAILVLY